MRTCGFVRGVSVNTYVQYIADLLHLLFPLKQDGCLFVSHPGVFALGWVWWGRGLFGDSVVRLLQGEKGINV